MLKASNITGHMASQETYPYTAKDLSRDECNLSGYKNSLIAAKVSGRVSVRHVETEENTIKVMSLQPITMFIEATRTLHSYKVRKSQTHLYICYLEWCLPDTVNI